MENRYGLARSAVENAPDFIDLIDTNFHRCGFRYPTAAIRDSVNRYFSESSDRHYTPDPAGNPELRAAIADYYQQSGLSASPDSIVVTASASEGYSHIFAAQCTPGDRVLLPRPGYPLFEDIAARSGLLVDFYDQQQDADWAIDTGHLADQIQPHTAAIVLISPNNPTGSVISETTIAAIGSLCEKHGLFLVVDEVFSEILFGWEGSATPVARLPRPARLLPGATVFTINGVSKLFASPDLKTSWILVNGPEDTRSQAVEKLLIQNDLYLSASSLSQHIVTDMFANGLEFTRTMAAEIRHRRDAMLRAVAGIDGASAISPAGGIHLPVTIAGEALPAGHDDEEVAVDLLRTYRLAVHPGYLYGLNDVVSVVVSYLAPIERIREGMSRLGSYLRAPSR